MKKFLWKLLLLLSLCTLALLLLTLVTFHVAAPQHRGMYNAAIADKVARLESLDSPKIILAGDSNLAFGIDSAKIEEAFGMPVVNLGGHGALGAIFHLNMAKRNIQPGDIVIVSNTSYASTGVVDPSIMWITIENDPDLRSMVAPQDTFKMLKALPKYLVKTLLCWVTGTGNQPGEDAYSITAFNKYGDNVFPRPVTTQYVFREGYVNPPPISDAGMQVINDFAAYCTQQGAVCLLAAEPVACNPETVPLEAFLAFDETLRQQAQCDVISSYPDYLLDHTLFFDQPAHLTDSGIQLRTQQLIEDLQTWMEGNPDRLQ